MRATTLVGLDHSGVFRSIRSVCIRSAMYSHVFFESIRCMRVYAPSDCEYTLWKYALRMHGIHLNGVKNWIGLNRLISEYKHSGAFNVYSVAYRIHDHMYSDARAFLKSCIPSDVHSKGILT